ncbi:activator of Hsp90 ATPase-like protein [Chitinophaga polysaccharea]|uniref:Activator of Hsp90 ATPase-like protein n=1 Tax=Chitinophaga polysaccharea TaxID=1293035 RepID=A0A561PRG5_9BACT|nr:SRPBCC domain-containing protein [Chitinophaga polysaccharea]TWF40708.1 activator of Hsp90 ATPase-like protein [Chitinophaga polysaccharea]
MNYLFSDQVTVAATPANVWGVLTDTANMKNWMGEPDMQLEITTTWEVNTPFIIRGFHHVRFENKGIIVAYETQKRLSYSHFSSVSRLPDLPENYSVLDFRLTPAADQTILQLRIDNFPTETIFKHLQFYWRTTLVKIKQATEGSLHS